jgi:3',5'-cyclic AMP phosphodiesterase CpdA
VSCRIAAITDIHYRPTGPVEPELASRCGAVLLRQTVERLNRFVRPDVVVVLGDLVHDAPPVDAPAWLAELRAILDQLACPWLVIPGNHDPPPAIFYAVFPRAECLDVNDVRLVRFVDEERPEWNAYRNAAGLQQMAAAAAGHVGSRVALQHVPVGLPGRETPYGYTNYSEVVAAMRREGYRLALSGHYHAGRPLETRDGITTMTVPALGEAPYSFAVVTVDGDSIQAEVLTQDLPAEPPTR